MSEARPSPLREAGRWLPGLLISAVALYALSRSVRWEDVRAAFAAMDWRYLIPVVIGYGISMAVRALAWRTLLEEKVTFWQSFLALNEGYMLNNVLPFRLGELGRALLLGQDAGLRTFRVLSTIVIERAYDLVLAAGLLLTTLPFVIGADWGRPVAVITLAVILAGLVSLHLMARFRGRLRAWLERLAERIGLLNRLLPRMDHFFDGLSALTDVRRFLLSFGLLALSWFLGIVVYYLMLLAFAPQAEFLWSAFSQGVLALGVALPSAPASLGVFEAAMVGALTLVGLSSATALAYGVTMHLVHFFFTNLFGIYALRRTDSLSAVYRRLTTRGRLQA